MGAPLLQRVPNPYFGIIPRSSSLGDPTIPVAQLLQAVSAVHDRQPLSQQRRHDDLSRRLREARTAAVARAVLSRELHAIAADGRCLVGVRRVDSDRAGGQLPGGRQLQPRARARLLDRRHPARVRRVGGVGPARSARPRARRPAASLGALVNDWTLAGVAHAAVGRADRGHADDQQQRVRRLRHAAAEPRRRSRRCRPTSDRRRAGSTPRRSRRRRSSRSARPRATRCGDPATATSTWR